MKQDNFKAHVALFLVNVLYVAGHLLAKGVMPQFLSPPVFIFLRVSGAVLFFWVLSLFIKKIKIARADLH